MEGPPTTSHASDWHQVQTEMQRRVTGPKPSEQDRLL